MTVASPDARRLPRPGSGACTVASLRAYRSDDLIGVQVGGAVKNVLAIAAGIADGLGFGANARAALITRGLAEMSRLGLALGAQPETFLGLSGVGDLVLTCTDNQSRNRRVGLALAERQDRRRGGRQPGPGRRRCGHGPGRPSAGASGWA